MTPQTQTALKPFPAASGLENLLSSLGVDSQTAFSYFNPSGNRGDGLIYLGTRQFFLKHGLAAHELPSVSAAGPGKIAVIGGSGAWFAPWCCGYMEV